MFLSKQIKKARRDETVKAVVLRINSPGGSALASDVIWRELILTRAQKPLIVSMGNVAASGGYYIACCADKIFASPNTITGSIGVFGILPNTENMFREKLGVTFDRVNTNSNSDLGSITRSLSNKEYKVIQQGVDEIYDDFITKVADGRKKLSKAEVDSIGQGRVWTGKDALKLGLVDELGGLEDALNAQQIAYKQIRQQNAGNRFQMVQQNIGTVASAAGLRETILQAVQIKSPVNGQLISIGKEVGDYTNPGDVMFTVMPSKGPLRAIVLISSSNVKRVTGGDAVLISPTESPATRFGYIKGTVIGVGNAPATQAEMMRAFGTTETTQSFTNSFNQQSTVDLPFIVLVEIEQDSQGRPVWTLGRQPPWGFRPGGVATVRIIDSTIRPIELLIPSLRKL